MVREKGGIKEKVMLKVFRKFSIQQTKLFLWGLLVVCNGLSCVAQTIPVTAAPPSSNMTPPGWTMTLGSSCDISSTIGWGGNPSYPWDCAIANPPTGQTSFVGGYNTETLQTSITGLNVGSTYTISFYLNDATCNTIMFSVFGWVPVCSSVRVILNGTIYDFPFSPPMCNWEMKTISFLATAPTMSFEVVSTVSDPNYVNIQNFWSLAVGPNAVQVDCLADFAPTLSNSSGCLSQSSFDLTSTTVLNATPNCIQQWYSSSSAGASTLLLNPNAVGVGQYYAAFYDTINDCYGPTSVFNVYQRPVAQFDVPLACDGQLTTLIDQSIIAGAPITNWNWSFTSGDSSLVQNAVHVFSGNNAVETVNLWVEDANGCSDSVDQQILINATPIANFGSLAHCSNEPVTFSDSSSVVGSTLVTWNWNFGDGSTSNTQNPIYQYSVAASYPVTLVVETLEGCTDTIVKQVATIAPEAHFNVANVCEGDPSIFSDSSNLSSGAIVSWNWNFGDGTSSNLQNPIHNYSVNGAYEVVLEVISSEGCTDTIFQEVTIYDTPVAGFAWMGECAEVVIPFSDSSTIENGDITAWFWQFGDGNSSSVQHPEHIYQQGGNQIVSLMVTSINGCTDSSIDTLNIISAPVADFKLNPVTPDILHSDVNFVNTSQNATTYSWLLDNAISSSIVNMNYQFPEEAGSHTVQLIATSASCADTIHRFFEIKDVLIYYVPNSFTPDGDEYNQTFLPIFTEGFDPFDYQLSIFNRWGEIIFQSKNHLQGWDGTYNGNYVVDGVYTWQIEFKTTISDERKTIEGHVAKIK